MSDYDKKPDDDIEYVSRSAMKREVEALQKIGVDLIELPEKQLAKFTFPEELDDAITLARRLKSREGKRRQLQFIGKLMRKVDMEPIQAVMNEIQNQSRNFRQHFHKLEEWRDRMIGEGDDALNEFLSEHPNADRQHLRQLIRQAKKELSQQKPAAASKKIFQYLKEATG